ncbi:MAG: hypothetical protein QW111_01965 [Ignisphaera sp.]
MRKSGKKKNGGKKRKSGKKKNGDSLGYMTKAFFCYFNYQVRFLERSIING